LSVETFHGYVRAVRRLFKWAYEKHLTISELWPVLKPPQIPEQEYKGVDDDHVLKLIEAARQASPRDYAIMLFLESTGARRGGVATLKLSDLDLSAPEPFCRRVTVHEKGKRIRKVILTPEALEALRAWLLVRKSKTNFVFVDERSKHDEGLKPGGISEIIRRYKERLGLVGRCSPHQWRHRRARCWLKQGMPLNLAGQLLGHKSNLVTAKYYGNMCVDDLQVAADHYYKPPK
jgi:integrase/recombinase XerD